MIYSRKNSDECTCLVHVLELFCVRQGVTSVCANAFVVFLRKQVTFERNVRKRISLKTEPLPNQFAFNKYSFYAFVIFSRHLAYTRERSNRANSCVLYSTQLMVKLFTNLIRNCALDMRAFFMPIKSYFKSKYRYITSLQLTLSSVFTRSLILFLLPNTNSKMYQAVFSQTTFFKRKVALILIISHNAHITYNVYGRCKYKIYMHENQPAYSRQNNSS